MRSLGGGGRYRLRVVVLVALVCGVVAPASSSAATTFHVGTSLDLAAANCAVPATCSLRKAVIDAVAGDTIIIDAGASPVLSSGRLALSKSLTIQGQGARMTSISGPVNGIFIVFTSPGQPTTTVAISNVTLTGGNVVDDPNGGGGALLNLSGAVSLTDVTVSGNTATDTRSGHAVLGGGIFNTGVLTLLRVTVSGNMLLASGSSGTVAGAGIASLGVLSATNSTITQNIATAGPSGTPTAIGGGIYQGGTATLTNVTLAENTATATGGVAFAEGGNIATIGGTTNLKLTIIANGTVTGASKSGSNCTGAPYVSQGYNLESTTPSQCGLVPAPGGTDLVGVTPLLGSLQNNGGQTDTRALLAGSLAINVAPAIQCTGPPQNGTDQRGPGFTRPVGLCDIGAFEVQAPYGFAPRVGGLRVTSKQVRFTLIAPAAVTITVHGVGRFTVQGHHGLNVIKLPAIVAGQRLRHGRYRITAVASVQGHPGRPTQGTLTI